MMMTVNKHTALLSRLYHTSSETENYTDRQTDKLIADEITASTLIVCAVFVCSVDEKCTAGGAIWRLFE